MNQEYEELFKAFHQLKRSTMQIKCTDISNVELMTLGMIANVGGGSFHCHESIQTAQSEKSVEGVEAQGIKVSELAKKLHTSKPDISKKIKNLEEKEFVKREGDPKDKRVTYVSLTDKGWQEYHAARKQTQDFIENVLERVGKENVEAFIVLLAKINDSVNEELEERKGDK